MKLEDIKTLDDYNQYLLENEINEDDFENKYEKYFWCVHCEKAFAKSEYLKKNECPYCHATPLDIWGWTYVRLISESYKVEYPEIPEIGKEYLLGNRE